ncbi:MAG TPA: ferritin-like domain-containing protein, partial [Polyangiaceae bacterium]|nr:ferritin-like domain-containing protein [Polyangiaceae bacterium]
NLQRLFPVKVGEEPAEMHAIDLELEKQARARLLRGITLTIAKDDHGTRQLLEKILENEEDAIDWLETQLHLIQELGRERYLAEQMHE